MASNSWELRSFGTDWPNRNFINCSSEERGNAADEPDDKSSTTTMEFFRRNNVATKCEPMKPAPPVTSKCTGQGYTGKRKTETRKADIIMSSCAAWIVTSSSEKPIHLG